MDDGTRPAPEQKAFDAHAFAAALATDGTNGDGGQQPPQSGLADRVEQLEHASARQAQQSDATRGALEDLNAAVNKWAALESLHGPEALAAVPALSSRMEKVEQILSESSSSALEQRLVRVEQHIADSMDRTVQFKDLHCLQAWNEECKAGVDTLSLRMDKIERFLGESVERNVQSFKDLDCLQARNEEFKANTDSRIEFLESLLDPAQLATANKLNELKTESVTASAVSEQRIAFVETLISESFDKHNEAIQVMDAVHTSMKDLVAKMVRYEVIDAKREQRIADAEALLDGKSKEIDGRLSSLLDGTQQPAALPAQALSASAETRFAAVERRLASIQEDMSAKGLDDVVKRLTRWQDEQKQTRERVEENFKEEFKLDQSLLTTQFESERKARKLHQDSTLEILAQERCTRESEWRNLEQRLTQFESAVWSVLQSHGRVADGGSMEVAMALATPAVPQMSRGSSLTCFPTSHVATTPAISVTASTSGIPVATPGIPVTTPACPVTTVLERPARSVTPPRRVVQPTRIRVSPSVSPEPRAVSPMGGSLCSSIRGSVHGGGSLSVAKSPMSNPMWPGTFQEASAPSRSPLGSRGRLPEMTPAQPFYAGSLLS